jgi:hypothetical protein
MITIKQFFETIDYKISEGSEYLWSCFGTNCRSVGYWNDLHDGVSFDCLYDTKTQTVYQVQAHDYANQRSYRWTHPDYVQAYRAEAEERGADVKEAYDDVNYTDLELAEDWLDKAGKIFRGEEYSTKVSVPLDISDSVLFAMMKQAHERDITLNQLVEEILWTVIDKKSV